MKFITTFNFKIFFTFKILLLFFICNDSFPIYIDTKIPSLSGGTTGIALRIHLPDTVRYRNEGAPVVIFLAGGNSVNAIDTTARYTRYGFILIQFNYPGGVNSGGVYDNRGENCILALRDVIKFATGQIRNNFNQYLHELTLSKIPVYTNVGIFGSSNGGNISIVTAGKYGDEINPAWIVNWESPVGEGMPDGECGVRFSSIGNQYRNPAYNPATGIFNYTILRYSDTVTVGSGGNSFHGGFYFDLNGNNLPNRGIDFIVNPYFVPNPPFGNKGYMSTSICREATNAGIFPLAPPVHVPTLAEAETFWRIRLGDYWIDSAIYKIPDLMFMVTASDTDHVQTALDHPHILIQYEGFRNAGARFVRLNSDRAYIEYVMGGLHPEARDNTAFTIFDHLTIRNTFEPESIPDIMYQSSAICEIADRTYMNNLSSQLSSVINTTSSLFKILLLPEGLYNSVNNSLLMKDTVKAYLRNSNSPFDIVDSSVSVIDSLTLAGSFIFKKAGSGTYYIIIKHRNSLETWSKSGGELFTSGSTMNYDFTNTQSQAYGNNLILKGSKYCIYSGDVNQDGEINLADLILVHNDASGFVTGYVVTDFTGDNFVDLSDINIVYNNALNFVSVRSPLTDY